MRGGSTGSRFVPWFQVAPTRPLLRIAFAALVAAGPAGCGVIRITSERTHDPRDERRVNEDSKVLDLELAHRLTYFDNVQVYRLEEAPSEPCDPGTTAGTKDVGCHRILESVEAPTVGWAKSMTSLVVWDSEFRDSDAREFREPTHAVRHVSEFGHADVLFSLRKKQLIVVSADVPPATGSFAKSYDRILLLAAAMPRDPELRDLMALEDSVRMDAIDESDPNGAKALWADCPPPPGESAVYDQEPVPITAPSPAYPSDAKMQRIQGKVVLHVYVDGDGIPCWVKVLSGDPVLSVAAVEAIRSWRFHPATKARDPVGAWIEIPMDFRL